MIDIERLKTAIPSFEFYSGALVQPGNDQFPQWRGCEAA